MGQERNPRAGAPGRGLALALVGMGLLAGPTGAGPSGQGSGERAVSAPALQAASAARTAELLRASRLDQAEERASRVRAIVALGPTVAPVVLDALTEGRFQGLSGVRADALLRPGEREVLGDVVRLLGRGSVASLLEVAQNGEQADQDRGRALRRVLEALVHCGTAWDIELAFDLVRGTDSSDAGASRLHGDLERVVREVSRRDAGGLRLAVGLLDRAPEALAAALVRGVAASDQPQALRTLAQAMGDRPQLHAVLLSQLPRAALRAPQPIDSWIQREVRLHLVGDKPQLARMAAAAAAGLWDFEAVPLLIPLIESEPAMAREARAALVQLAGKDLGADPDAWSNWLRAERDWRERELPRLERDLRSGEPGKVVVALRELSARRYRRVELVALVEPALHHASAGVRKSACEALTALAVPHSAAGLVPLLDDPDADVGRAAWSALVALTGERHPPQGAAWRVALCLRD